MYEMSTLERPFDATLMHQLVFKIVHGELPEMPTGYRPELAQLLTSIMQKDPAKRPTATEILSHKFFQGSKTPNSAPEVLVTYWVRYFVRCCAIMLCHILLTNMLVFFALVGVLKFLTP